MLQFQVEDDNFPFHLAPLKSEAIFHFLAVH